MSLLGRDAYISQDWYNLEQSRLFSQTWQFVGLETELKTQGDYLTGQLGLYPIVVLRLAEAEIAAFHNVCRHRGSTLLGGSGNTGKSIVCPYHRWTYVLDGRLKGVPDAKACFPNLDRASLSLKPAGVGIFNGLIFVNPDPNADFKDFIEPIRDKAWPHDLTADDVTEGPPLHYKLKCNWKVFVENGLDGYHLAYLHEKTLGGPKVSENIWERHGDHAIWYAMEEEDIRHSLPAKNRKEAQSCWARKLKSADSVGYGGVYHLFPNTLITATPYTFSISVLHPTSPTHCDLIVRHFSKKGEISDQRKHIPGYDKNTDTIRSELWTKPPLETGDFQTEDVWICEKVQNGLKSPAFELGPLSVGPGAEDPITWFHDAISNRISHDMKF